MPTNVTIVGAGPRGLSVLERMTADLLHRSAGPATTVHLVDPFVGVGGAVWRTDQPGTLLMNTVAGQITMFTDPTVDCAGPVLAGPSLYEWARRVAELPGDVRPEAAALGPDSYPTRRLYGHYLAWVLEHLTERAAGRLTVVPHRRTAVAVEDGPGGRQSVRLDDGTVLPDQDAVVLAQGHVTSTPAPTQFAGSPLYQPPANPADVDVSRFPPGRRVGLRGMGLTFFDYLAMFTEGRGGRFERQDGRLVYLPSGREPLLVAGSRRGVPYHSRGENQKGVSGRHRPLFLTPDRIADFQARARAGRPPEFVRDVWPLISLEVRAVYYATAVREIKGDVAAAAFLTGFVRAGGESSDVALIRDFLPESTPLWDWNRIARPYGERSFTSQGDFHGWLLGHLREDVAEGRRGNVDSPLKSAIDALRDLRNEVRLVVDHGGISGRSYRDELQAWYTPLNAYLSIGPPVVRIEQMVALIEAGLLTVLGPDLRVDPAPESGFLMRSAHVPGPPVRVSGLIEARLHETDLRDTEDPLLRRLTEDGQCRQYRIGDFRTGGLAVTRRPYRLVDAAGKPHPHRYAFGVPTEAVHWVTAAGIRPEVNSVILTDADAIARACLNRPGDAARHSLYLSRYKPLAWLPTSADEPVSAR